MQATETVDATDASITRMRRFVVVLMASTTVTAAVAVVAVSLAHSRAWSCPADSPSGSGFRKDLLLARVMVGALIAGSLLSVLAFVTWCRIGHRSEIDAPWRVVRRWDALQTWAGRAAMLGLVSPLAIAVIASIPTVVAHCGD